MSATLVFALAAFVSAPAVAAEWTGRASVVDSDTIDLDGAPARIRLFGIDAPESGQTCEDATAKRFLCGVRAAEALAALIGRNGRVSCVERDRDRWRRVVAVCALAGVDLGDAMVRNGWALDFARYSGGRYEAAEEAARDGSRGLWAGNFEPPWEWRSAERSPRVRTYSSTRHGRYRRRAPRGK